MTRPCILNKKRLSFAPSRQYYWINPFSPSDDDPLRARHTVIYIYSEYYYLLGKNRQRAIQLQIISMYIYSLTFLMRLCIFNKKTTLLCALSPVLLEKSIFAISRWSLLYLARHTVLYIYILGVLLLIRESPESDPAVDHIYLYTHSLSSWDYACF